MSEMIPNKEKDICANCKKGVGEIPISDGTLINFECNTFWICEVCDKKIFD